VRLYSGEAEMQAGMKDCHMCYLSGIITLALALMAPAGELLKNPSFEQSEQEVDNPYGDLAAHWGRWGNWMNREEKWKPTHHGRCLIGYHHWQVEEGADSGIFQDVEDLPPASKCTFSVYASRDARTNVESVELRLEPLKGGKELASQTFKPDDIKANAWTELSVTGENVTQGIRALVIVKPKSGKGREGALKFDDASLVTGDDANRGGLASVAARRK